MSGLSAEVSSSILPSVIPSSPVTSPARSRHDPVANPSSACCSPAVPAVVFLLSFCCPIRLKANLRLCSTHFSACRACTSGVPTGLESARIRGGIQTGPIRLPLYCVTFRPGRRRSSNVIDIIVGCRRTQLSPSPTPPHVLRMIQA
jgi:hypothetical protein